jgi:hypothetical protein
MPVVFALSLLQVAVYAEAAVILVLLLAVGYLLLVWIALTNDCDRAEAERNEARRTLDTLRRMIGIHTDTDTRLRGYGR